MEDDNKNFFNEIFKEFTILESAYPALIDFAKNLKGTKKEKFTNIVLLKELALQKIPLKILSEDNIKDLVFEVNQKLNPKAFFQGKEIKSFDDIQTDNTYTFDDEIIKCNYLYNNYIIYVDSVNDYQKEDKKVFSNAVDKPNMFLTQFNLLQYFLLQSENYKSSLQTNKEGGITLTSLGSIIGLFDEEVTVFGTLIVNGAGKYQLQDNQNLITLDLSTVKNWGKGYFCTGCSVICQGLCKNNTLKVYVIMHPPPVFNFKNFKDKFEKDFFGAITKVFKLSGNNFNNEAGNSPITKLIPKTPERKFEERKEVKMNRMKGKKEESKNNDIGGELEEEIVNENKEENLLALKQVKKDEIEINLEKMARNYYNPNLVKNLFKEADNKLLDEFVLILSNVVLTDPKVLEAIEKIVEGYKTSEENKEEFKYPFMIIFIGNFIHEQSLTEFKIIEKAFEDLESILKKNKSLIENTHIVFIPGNEDFSLFSGFPKYPFMPDIIKKMEKSIPSIINATNPARFSFFGKEIVLFREDLHKKLARNSIRNISEDVDEQRDYFIQTVLGQGNLAPTNLAIIPRIWHLGNCMSILPLPDILILADVVEDFSIDLNKDILVVNPGNFCKDFSFALLFPKRMECQICKVE